MAEISCDCSIEGADEGNECYRDIIRTARRFWRCCECHEQIKPGNQYEHVSAKFDGTWGQFQTCLPCLAIRRRYCPNGWWFGDLADNLRECLGFDHLKVPEEAEE
jgi:hypothetical protein